MDVYPLLLDPDPTTRPFKSSLTPFFSGKDDSLVSFFRLRGVILTLPFFFFFSSSTPCSVFINRTRSWGWCRRSQFVTVCFTGLLVGFCLKTCLIFQPRAKVFTRCVVEHEFVTVCLFIPLASKWRVTSTLYINYKQNYNHLSAVLFALPAQELVCCGSWDESAASLFFIIALSFLLSSSSLLFFPLFLPLYRSLSSDQISQL